MKAFQSKKVLVTGGSGFLGSWMCEILMKEGSDVTCLDNFSTGMKMKTSHINGKDRFHLIVGGVEELHQSEKFDYILHFASRPSPEEYQKNPIETLKVNSLDTMRLLDTPKSIILYLCSLLPLKFMETLKLYLPLNHPGAESIL